MIPPSHTLRDFGSVPTDKGVRFSIWAPTAEQVCVVVAGQEHALTANADGFHSAVVPDARPGDLYVYRIDGLDMPDPASRFQPSGVPGPSCVVDPHSYRWKNEHPTLPWERAIIWEAHVGTATSEGTFAALSSRLSELASFGITAIQLMPVAETPGARTWGYDGVLPFAPNSAYGAPDDLKALVDHAHELGLIVLLDVVFNHFGPSENYLGTYAKPFFTDRHQTPWGAAIDWRTDPARRFFIENAVYWLTEYRFDGLRLDAVHQILDDSDDHFLDELARYIRSRIPDRAIHLVLENEANESRRLERAPDGSPRTYTAQWDDDIHNAWHALLTGESDGYYSDFADAQVAKLGRALAEGFVYQGDVSAHLGRARGEPSAHLPPQAFVSFLQNHDQIGNRALGERLCQIVAPERLAVARAALFLSPQIPMIFMGEEWGASSPFQYFVDFPHDQNLQTAIREGRRREFTSFTAFMDQDIPDPNAEETFIRSRIDWDERVHEPHRSVHDETRALIALRQAHIVPLLLSGYDGAELVFPDSDSIDLVWRFKDGDLRFIANFGTSGIVVPEPDSGKTLWRTGPPPSSGALLPWSCIVLTSLHA